MYYVLSLFMILSIVGAFNTVQDHPIKFPSLPPFLFSQYTAPTSKLLDIVITNCAIVDQGNRYALTLCDELFYITDLKEVLSINATV